MNKTGVYGFLAVLALMTVCGGMLAAEEAEELSFQADEPSLARWRAYLEAGGDVERTDDLSGDSALMQAAEAGNVALCELLIKHGADVNHQSGWKKTTPLMKAVNAGREVCELLLKHGAKMDAEDYASDTAFHHIRQPREDVLQLFLDAGVNVNLAGERRRRTLLMSAALESVELVKLLLARGADVNLRDEDGWPALTFAMEFQGKDEAQHVALVRMLLDAGAEVNSQDDHGEAALHRAAGRYPARLAVVDVLLEAGAEVDIGPEGQSLCTPLHYALDSGNADVAMKLLDAGADITRRPAHCHIPLHLAARTFSRPLMERMIKMGADIHEKSNWGDETLLLAVAKVGDVETAKWLLSLGLDVNTASQWGKTPLTQALEDRQDEMVHFLVAQGAKPDGEIMGSPLLSEAVRYGNLELARFLVKHGARFLDEPDDYKKLLHWAVESGSREMCEYILNFNPDANVQDGDRNTPLHYAAEKADHDLCVLLLARGAKVNAKNKHGETPLMNVVKGDDHTFYNELPRMRVRVWRLLMDAGADIHAENESGVTPLGYVWQFAEKKLEEWSYLQAYWRASEKLKEDGEDTEKSYLPDFFVKYVETSTGHYRNADKPASLFMAVNDGDMARVKRLLDAGQDVNQCDRDDETALHFAVRAGNAEMVTFLLDSGADIHTPEACLGTPLHYAAGLGQREIMELLIARGADVNVETKGTSHTPLHWAVAASHGPCVVSLVKHGADAGGQGVIYVPFRLAMRMGKLPYCKFFCENGFHWEKYAAHEEYFAMHSGITMTPAEMQILLDCGQNLHAQDKDGMTLLHYAAGRRSIPLLRFLLKHGVDPTVKNTDGLTPLQWLQETFNMNAEQRQMEIILSR